MKAAASRIVRVPYRIVHAVRTYLTYDIAGAPGGILRALCRVEGLLLRALR